MPRVLCCGTARLWYRVVLIYRPHAAPNHPRGQWMCSQCLATPARHDHVHELQQHGSVPTKLSSWRLSSTTVQCDAHMLCWFGGWCAPSVMVHRGCGAALVHLPCWLCFANAAKPENAEHVFCTEPQLGDNILVVESSQVTSQTRFSCQHVSCAVLMRSLAPERAGLSCLQPAHGVLGSALPLL